MRTDKQTDRHFLHTQNGNRIQTKICPWLFTRQKYTITRLYYNRLWATCSVTPFMLTMTMLPKRMSITTITRLIIDDTLVALEHDFLIGSWNKYSQNISPFFSEQSIIDQLCSLFCISSHTVKVDSCEIWYNCLLSSQNRITNFWSDPVSCHPQFSPYSLATLPW